MSVWRSFGSILRSEVIGLAVFSNIHVDSHDEIIGKYNQCVQRLSLFVQKMAKRKSRIQWCRRLHGITATSESVDGASKVVDLVKLHRYGCFPAWITMDLCALERLQGGQQHESHDFSIVLDSF